MVYSIIADNGSAETPIAEPVVFVLLRQCSDMTVRGEEKKAMNLLCYMLRKSWKSGALPSMCGVPWLLPKCLWCESVCDLGMSLSCVVSKRRDRHPETASNGLSGPAEK